MNAHIRVRPYPRREHGWMAWLMYYQGDILPLAADEPYKEILPAAIDSKSMIGRLYKFETHMTSSFNIFMRDLLVIAKEAGYDRTDPFKAETARITFIQKKQEDFVDRVVVQRMFGAEWFVIARLERNPLDNTYYDVTKANLQEIINHDD